MSQKRYFPFKKISSQTVKPLIFTALENNSTIKLQKGGNPNPNEFYTKQGNGDWQLYTIGTAITLNQGQSVEFKGLSSLLNVGWQDRYTFTGTGSWKAQGSLTRLVNDNRDLSGQPFSRIFYCGYNLNRDWSFPLVDAKDLEIDVHSLQNNYACCRMFESNTYLTAAPQVIRVEQPLSGHDQFGAAFLSCTNLVIPPSSINIPAFVGSGSDCIEMFNYCTSLTSTPLLPATTLAADSYQKMFNRCTSLVSVSPLPATTVAQGSYYQMFRTCSSLVTPPSTLSFTQAKQGCCCEMFCNCYSLTATPQLPATGIASGCYRAMFKGCSSLIEAVPVLPITDISNADWCYSQMYANCTSLTNGGTISASITNNCNSGMLAMYQGCTNLVQMPSMNTLYGVGGGCCSAMFSGCTSLTGAEELKLGNDVWYDGCKRMFANCTSLTVLPTNLQSCQGSSSYHSMFYMCTSLTDVPSTLFKDGFTPSNYSCQAMFNTCWSLTGIAVKFTSFNESLSSFYLWTLNTGSNGTFTCPTALGTNDTILRGDYGVPARWTVVNYDSQ